MKVYVMSMVLGVRTWRVGLPECRVGTWVSRGSLWQGQCWRMGSLQQRERWAPAPAAFPSCHKGKSAHRLAILFSEPLSLAVQAILELTNPGWPSTQGLPTSAFWVLTRILFCCPSWPQICSNPPASASWALKLQAWATMPNFLKGFTTRHIAKAEFLF